MAGVQDKIWLTLPSKFLDISWTFLSCYCQSNIPNSACYVYFSNIVPLRNSSSFPTLHNISDFWFCKLSHFMHTLWFYNLPNCVFIKSEPRHPILVQYGGQIGDCGYFSSIWWKNRWLWFYLIIFVTGDLYHGVSWILKRNPERSMRKLHH